MHELPVDDWQKVRGVDGDGIFYVMKYCVRVNAIAPTVVWTPLVERFARMAPDPAAMRAALENYNPIPGIPLAEDIASVVAFLASDEARWITGHTLPIDGGYCAQ